MVCRRSHPKLARSLSHAATRGEIVALLPGVYAPRALATDWQVLALAACLWDPNGVLVGDAAAALTYWPELTPRVVTLAGRRTTVTRRGLVVVPRAIPPELVTSRGDLRFTVPDFTAVDLAGTRGGAAIDRALRSRMATLSGMHEALRLTPWRRNNPGRRLALLDSRDEPWTETERLTHRLFREAGITGWRANVPFYFEGRNYFLDIAFRNRPLVVEIDGRIHLSPEVFDTDRRRGNDLLLAGKHTLHFTDRMVLEEAPMVVQVTLRALEMPWCPTGRERTCR